MNRTKAFTLVEMSIVLVVIGLLTGGIMAGKGLIRSAQIRAVGEEMTSYINAVNVFKDRYGASMPGDMPDATSVWGVAGGTGSDAVCQAVASTTTATCNGDGDGTVNGGGGSNEMFRFWQHLANAGLIDGTYTGTVETIGQANSHQPGLNCPKSKLDPGGWSTRYFNAGDGVGSVFLYDHGQIMIFGGDVNNNLPLSAILTPREVAAIDRKFDDGKPGLGKLEVYGITPCTNAASSADYSADYLLSSSTTSCGLLVRMTK